MYTNCGHLLGILKHIQDRFLVNEADTDPVLLLEPSLGVIFDEVVWSFRFPSTCSQLAARGLFL